MAQLYCSRSVDSKAAAVTTRSVTSSARVRLAGTAYRRVVTTVQATMPASTAQAQGSRE